jgi:acyl-CoA thioesterase
MPYKELSKRRENDRKWRANNPGCYQERYKKYIEKTKEYKQKNKERIRQYQVQWNLKNHDKAKQYWIKYNHKVKELVFSHYGKKCVLCGFSDMRALSIDHTNGDGAKHRKEVGGSGTGKRIYSWLVKNNYPDNFRTLCMNCQWIERSRILYEQPKERSFVCFGSKKNITRNES